MRQRKLLLVAATGGHLTELLRLAPRFEPSEESVWVTFDTEQSRSMLAGRNVFYVPYISPRDWQGTVQAFRLLASFLETHEFEAVYSTGSAVALAAFLQPRLRNTPKTYIESVSRTKGPSLTGRLTSFFPSIRLFTQHKSWASKRWNYIESVLAQYNTTSGCSSEGENSRLFVTLGTIKPYRFDALVDTVLESGYAGPDTIWQLGSTDRHGLPGEVFTHMDAAAFTEAARAANVVVTHAGVGTVMQLLEMGKSPVVVPREKNRGEHVDDHQFQISELLIEQNLAVVARVQDLSANHMKRAMNQRTELND